jgi:hypothetical protein
MAPNMRASGSNAPIMPPICDVRTSPLTSKRIIND